ncbi:putative transmembrane protein [Mycoplasma mycoides subsp. mycoides KH3J]|uniref:Hypothetical transmembrane protein n=1 Tax=Mycoplasma mycoides subsp. mycoides SC (strain CCUG 32753 / NCTC 10114 / PG1) TaxID=272632 RepID=Q6MU77_MYCMS|nr:hypothetical protein MSCc_6100 [Mycoplasma mycoides subsp. mycoides C425/93]PTD33160.1 putative transmembrane protein [Mycoplasma mycoides subsp. mycoides KH3J]PTD33393.1 putative transmembrane protein [Mycoplasma mycoides subsp. mycoides str. Gemu Goffa]PTD34214.1 putative transmembrane protein [Mycoplasma mycoides subsp. mycoides PO-67]TNJ31129.1 hypothetical protein FFR90_00925 [Mycoplasma mycoides subsp. mycoides]CAE76809.1 Hypothetical transmembrane protein [Mycoplasma mycoides subsp. 
MSKFYKRYWLKSSFKKIELFKILVKTTNIKKGFVKFYLLILEIQYLLFFVFLLNFSKNLKNQCNELNLKIIYKKNNNLVIKKSINKYFSNYQTFNQILITYLTNLMIIKLDKIIVRMIKIIKIFLKRILWYLLIITWFLIRLI